MSLAFIDCILAVQLVTAVAKNFSWEIVGGVRWCTLIDIRTKQATRFKADEHFLHIFGAAFDNFAGEDYASLSNRGKKKYVPVIVTGRYFSFLVLSKSSMCVPLTLLIVRAWQPPWRYGR